MRRSQRDRLAAVWVSRVPTPGAGRAQRRAKHEVELTDQQFSFGEVRYLIAEVPPFGFSWRGDVLGNLLAILFNVIDASRAPGGY